MPSALPAWLFRMGDRRQVDLFVGIHIALGRTKGEVRFDETDGEEERFVRVGQIFELFETGVGDQAIMVDGVIAFGALEGFQFVFREGSDGFDLPVSQAMHSASWVFPLAGRHELTIPGAGHFDNVVVVPVFAAPAAWVVRDFAD